MTRAKQEDAVREADRLDPDVDQRIVLVIDATWLPQLAPHLPVRVHVPEGEIVET